MRILHVGDVHAEVSCLDDCKKLIDLIYKTARSEKFDEYGDFILFEGDQFHNNSIVHVDVLAFWHEAFNRLTCICPVKCLVGNHDMSGIHDSPNNAMQVFDKQVDVISRSKDTCGILFLPHYPDPKKFIEACVESECKTVVCHQTFTGSEFDGGFFAKDGVDPLSIPQTKVISGHIHTPQSFGKVFYTGASRWRTLSDANYDRSIWVIEYNNDGSVESAKPISTGDVCQRIWHLEDTPAFPVTVEFNQKDQYRIDIKGPAAYVEKRKTALQTLGVRIRCFPDQDQSFSQVRESEGIGKAFEKYFNKYKPVFGTPPEVLKSVVKERLWT